MTKYYKFNPKQKKQMLTKWLNSQEKYRARRVVSYIFYAIATAVCLGCFLFVYLLADDSGQNNAFSSGMLGLIIGFIFGCIPFFIGQAIHTKSKKEYGRPFCRMTREFLYADDKGVQFGYHSTENKYTASMDVYQILYEDINRVNFDSKHNIITIVGCGNLTAYDDYSTKRINHNLSGRKFYGDSCYSFILAFDEQDEFLKLLKSKQNWED